jgi:signal transduction histidine kinase
MNAIRDAERRRIARELHGSTSQLLVALQLQLGELRVSRMPAAEPLLDEMAQVIRDLHKSIKQIGLSRSSADENPDGAQVAVARVFYSLSAVNTSVR